MKTLANRIALFAASAIVLGSAAYGQTAMTVDIPFAFRASNTTLPAGHYNLVQDASSGGTHVRFWNAATRQAVLASAGPVDHYSTGHASIIFQCNSRVCALSKIRTDNGTVSYAVPRITERPVQSAAVSIPLVAGSGQ